MESIGAFVAGAIIADAVTYGVHRLQHSRFRLTGLHKTRHHVEYAASFLTTPSKSPLPSIADLDESALAPILPFGLYMRGETELAISTMFWLAVAFYLHAAAHSGLPCPAWYAAGHRQHHLDSSSSFSLLSPFCDHLLGTTPRLTTGTRRPCAEGGLGQLAASGGHPAPGDCGEPESSCYCPPS